MMESENGNNFELSVDELSKEWIQKYFEQHGRAPTGIGSETISALAENEETQGILQEYLALVNEDKNLDTVPILKLIKNNPHHAKELYSIFHEYPDLIAIYSEKKLNSEDCEDEPLSKYSRITKTDNPDKIEGYTSSNREIIKKLYEKFDLKILESGSPWQKCVLSCFDGDVGLWLGIIKRGDRPSWNHLRIEIKPNQKGKTDFGTIHFQISFQGLIDSDGAIGASTKSNLGYLFWENNYKVDEKALIDLLLKDEAEEEKIEGLEYLLLDFIGEYSVKK